MPLSGVLRGLAAVLQAIFDAGAKKSLDVGNHLRAEVLAQTELAPSGKGNPGLLMPPLAGIEYQLEIFDAHVFKPAVFPVLVPR